MAAEISIEGALSITKDGGTASVAVALQEDITGSQKFGDSQVIGDSYEQLYVPNDLTNETSGARWVMVKNLSASYSIRCSYQSNDTGTFALIGPGQFALVPVGHWGAIANSAVPFYLKCTTAGQSALASVVVSGR